MLGELDGEELKETTLDPNNRTLIKITSLNIESENNLFTTLFGNNTSLRKEFIKNNLSAIL